MRNVVGEAWMSHYSLVLWNVAISLWSQCPPLLWGLPPGPLTGTQSQRLCVFCLFPLQSARLIVLPFIHSCHQTRAWKSWRCSMGLFSPHTGHSALSILEMNWELRSWLGTEMGFLLILSLKGAKELLNSVTSPSWIHSEIRQIDLFSTTGERRLHGEMH